MNEPKTENANQASQQDRHPMINRRFARPANNAIREWREAGKPRKR